MYKQCMNNVKQCLNSALSPKGETRAIDKKKKEKKEEEKNAKEENADAQEIICIQTQPK